MLHLSACWLSLRTCTLARACQDYVFDVPGVLLAASRVVGDAETKTRVVARKRAPAEAEATSA